MNTPHDSVPPVGDQSGCPSREALEEYAVRMPLESAQPGGGTEAFRAHDVELTQHVKSCAACEARLEETAEETAFFVEALCKSAPVGSGPSECPEEIELAIYLDASMHAARSSASGLESERWSRLQEHLAACKTCQGRLVALYREVRAVLADLEAPPQGECVSLEEAHRLQESKAISSQTQSETTLEDAQATSVESSSDERRKQRYSSQSS